MTDLRLLDDLGDPPPAVEVLPEEVGAAQVAAPHVVDRHGGVDLVQQAAQDVLVAVVGVHHGRHLLQHPEGQWSNGELG